jgi:hypothetical protein
MKPETKKTIISLIVTALILVSIIFIPLIVYYLSTITCGLFPLPFFDFLAWIMGALILFAILAIIYVLILIYDLVRSELFNN